MKLPEFFTETDQELLFESIRRYEKFCRAIAKRPMQGYGKASEIENKQNWLIKADELRELESKIANEMN